MTSNNPWKIGTLCGTILGILGNLGFNDLIQTALLAGVGAFVSFVVSYILKKLEQSIRGSSLEEPFLIKYLYVHLLKEKRMLFNIAGAFFKARFYIQIQPV